jgi:hypothetical protein
MGDRLRTARIAAGYATGTAAAEAFGWKPSTYLGHENGDRELSKAAARRYGTALKVDPAYLLWNTPNAKAAALDPERMAHVIGALVQRLRKDISAEDAGLMAQAAIVRARQPENPQDEPLGRLQEQILAQFGAQKLAEP